MRFCDVPVGGKFRHNDIVWTKRCNYGDPNATAQYNRRMIFCWDVEVDNEKEDTSGSQKESNHT